MPDKLYELTTCSGRKIKATIDHPFLVNTGGELWKSLGKMVLTDKIIIRHSVKHLPEEQTVSPPVIIRKTGIPTMYRESLTAAGILEENCR
jgi:intein/homing endonuclease